MLFRRLGLGTLLIGLVCGILVEPARGATNPEKVLDGLRSAYAPLLQEAPDIDGRLDEPFWESAERLEPFILNHPVFSLSVNQTSVRLARDKENLYIAFECPGPNVLFNNDCIEVFLMPEPEGKLFYHLALDSAGQFRARKEMLKEGAEFDNQIKYAVSTGDKSWTAELAIPFRNLFVDISNPLQGAWRVNFCRQEKESGELSTWNRLVGPFRNPERFGRLVFTADENYQKQKESFLLAVQEVIQTRKERLKSQEKSAEKERLYDFCYAFSFGPQVAPLKSGYRRVTPETAYATRKGYGWTGSLAGLESGCQTLSIEELFSSFIKGVPVEDQEVMEHTFRVDLLDGEYKVHLIMGEAGTEAKPHRRLFEVCANDRIVFPVEVGNSVFAQPYFRVKVTDGSIRIKFRGNRKIHLELSPEVREAVPDEMEFYVPGWIVNALVVYPAKDRKAAEKQIARDEQDFNLLPPEKLALAEEVKPPEEKPLTDITIPERNRGFLVFTRDSGVHIFKTSVPKRSEITDSLTLRVTPGETTNTTLGIYPLKDLNRLKVLVSDLNLVEFIPPTSPPPQGGRVKVGADRIEVGMVRSVPHGNSSKYTLLPFVVEPIKYVDTDLNEGETRQIWFTLRIPEDTAPGIYRGKIILSVEEGEIPRLLTQTPLLQKGNEMTVKLNLTVLPFILADSRKRFGFYLPEVCGSDWVHTDRHLSSMRDHLMNAVEFNANDAEDIRRKLRLAKRSGFTGPIPFYQTWFGGERTKLIEGEKKYLKNFLAELNEYYQVNNLPKPLFYAWNKPLTSGSEIVAYSANPNSVRFNYGWFTWSVGLDGDVSRAYMTYSGNPYNCLTGKNSLVCIPGSVGGYNPLPTLNFEMARMGINDYRYIQTLANLIEEGKKSGDKKVIGQAKEEETNLNKITDSVQDSLKYYDVHGYWKDGVYQKLRDRITDGIIRLLKAMGKI